MTLPIDQLIDYLAGALAPADEERVELHLFECATCTAEAERLAVTVRAVRDFIPPIVTAAQLAHFTAGGSRHAVVPVPAGSRGILAFPEGVEMLVLRLEADLGAVDRLACELRVPGGPVIMRFDDVPFDPAERAVYMCCRKHYVGNFGAGIDVHLVSGERDVATYSIGH